MGIISNNNYLNGDSYNEGYFDINNIEENENNFSFNLDDSKSFTSFLNKKRERTGGTQNFWENETSRNIQLLNEDNNNNNILEKKINPKNNVNDAFDNKEQNNIIIKKELNSKNINLNKNKKIIKLNVEKVDNYNDQVFDSFINAIKLNEKTNLFINTIVRNIYDGNVNDSKNVDYNQVIKNTSQIIKFYTTKKTKLKDKKEDKKIIDIFNNIKLFNNIPQKSDFNMNYELSQNKSNKPSTQFNNLEEKKTSDNSNKENNLDLEINIINRQDNLFERYKSMLIDIFIDEFNRLVEEENKFPKKVDNFLNIIKGKSDNIKFFNTSFENNFILFGKKSSIIQKIILKAIKNIRQVDNKEVIELIEKTPSQYIKDLINDEKKGTEFFGKDILEKIKKTQCDKCKIILNDFIEKKNLVGLITLAEFVEKNNDDYIRIKDLQKFEERVKKIKNYENVSLLLTKNEIKKIHERFKILYSFAISPDLYLKNLKEKKSGIKEKIN